MSKVNSCREAVPFRFSGLADAMAGDTGFHSGTLYCRMALRQNLREIRMAGGAVTRRLILCSRVYREAQHERYECELKF